MFSLKLYRFLLQFYPATFRENYAEPLEREFLDECGDAPTRWAVAKLWLHTLADFAASMPRMLVREFFEDASHTVRLWTKRPLPVAMAITALAIGIGANIGAFSVIDALMMRSLPFREPDRLVMFDGHVPVGYDGTPARFYHWRDLNTYLDNAANYSPTAVNLADNRNPLRVNLTETTANFFELMGSPARAGRAFASGEDEPGRDSVAVIGYGLWQRMFGGETRAIGSKIVVNGTPLEVIGVAPPGFDYPDKSEIWTPTVYDFDRISKNSVSFMRTVGRLKSGLTLAQASAAYTAEVPPDKSPAAKGFDRRNHLTPLRDQLAGPLKKPALILSAAVLLLLLIACANVANLLLSRTAERVNELAIRSALGASSARLIRQLLTESLVLAAAGGLSSVLVAHWTVNMAAAFEPPGLAAQAYTLGDWRIAFFGTALVLLTGLLFGVAPALFAGSELVRSNSQRRSTSIIRSTLVAVQVALTVILLAGAASLGSAFRSLMQVDNGYDTRNVVSLKLSLTGGRYEKPEANEAYRREAERRLRQLDGVVSTGTSLFLPLGTHAYMAGSYNIDRSGTAELSLTVPVGPGFFETLGTPLFAGALPAENAEKEKQVVVTEAFARHFTDHPATIVGRTLTGRGSWTPARIAGVVQSLNFNGPAIASVSESQVFPFMWSATNFVIRVKGDPHQHLAAIRAAIQSVDPEIPVYNVMTMDERLADVTARPRFYMLATVMFGCCALLLTIVGLYGMIAYSVAQRTREMGIRLALGTTSSALRLLMLRQGLLLVVLGAIPGLIATLFAAQWLEELVGGATEVTSIACAGSLLAIAIVAAISAWTATSRVSRLDPAAALRVE